MSLPALGVTGSVLASGGSGPVIPNFTSAHCPASTTFCWSWLSANWGPVLQPALLQHVYMTAIAVAIGLVISLAAALFAVRRGWFEKGFLGLSTLLYTIPSLAFFLFFVPITGISLLTIEIG
ncbi:MAG: ABC transporter permease, partial [Acidimicrobiales bacterium]